MLRTQEKKEDVQTMRVFAETDTYAYNLNCSTLNLAQLVVLYCLFDC